MKNIYPLALISITVFSLLGGCVPVLIPLSNDYQSIDPQTPQDKVKKAVMLGGTTAGWRINHLKPGVAIATLDIRGHKVIVTIEYDNTHYNIFYKNSIGMKVRCYGQRVPIVTQPNKKCPGTWGPTHIHENYKVWVENLKISIQDALRKFLIPRFY